MMQPTKRIENNIITNVTFILRFNQSVGTIGVKISGIRLYVIVVLKLTDLLVFYIKNVNFKSISFSYP